MIANLFLPLCFLFSQAPPAVEVDMRCGGYCLYTSLKALDVKVPPYKDFEAKLGASSARGYSMEQLSRTAREYGAYTLGVVTTPETLTRRTGRFACIARIGSDHFVNIAKVAGGTAHIIDAPKKYELPLETLRQQWDGKALLVSTGPLATEESLTRGKLLPIGLGIGAFLFAILFGGTLLWRRKRERGA